MMQYTAQVTAHREKYEPGDNGDEANNCGPWITVEFEKRSERK